MKKLMASRKEVNKIVPEFPAGSGADKFQTTEELMSNIYVGVSSSGEKEIPIMENVRRKEIGWNYYFSVSPTSMNFPGNQSGSQGFSVTSYRIQTVDGVETSVRENVGWNSSMSGSNNFSVAGSAISYGKNNSVDTLTGTCTLTQANSGKTASINISQGAGDVTWDYYFSVSPTTINFTSAASERDVSASSYRKRRVNGIEDGYQENLNWGWNVTSGDFITVGGVTVSVTANNTVNSRSGTINCYQMLDGSKTGQEMNITVNQDSGSVSWSYYISVTPTSLSFPYSATTAVMTCNAGRNRLVNGIADGYSETVSFATSSSVSWLTTTQSGSTVNATATRNDSKDARNGTLTFYCVDSTGTTQVVNTSQEAGQVGWNYYFSIDPNSESVDALSHSIAVSVISYRRETINGIETGVQEDVTDWGVYDFPSWMGAAKSTTWQMEVAVYENRTLSSRSGNVGVIQGPSSKTVQFTVSQAAGVEHWDYTFSVDPTSWEFSALGGSKSINFTSYKQRYINGTTEGRTVSVGHSRHSTPAPGFSADETSISASENTVEQSRSSSVQYIQSESGKLVTISMSQEAATYSWRYYFSGTEQYSVSALAQTKEMSASSYKRFLINNKEQSGDYSVDWSCYSVSGNFLSISGKNVIITENQSESTRSGRVTVRQNESNGEFYVTIDQAAATITFDYVFNINNSSVVQTTTFESSGGSSSISVNSKRTRYINGTAQTQEDIPYDSAFGNFSEIRFNTLTSATINCNRNENPSERQETLYIKQIETGNTAGHTIKQEAGIATIWRYNFSYGGSGISQIELSTSGNGYFYRSLLLNPSGSIEVPFELQSISIDMFVADFNDRFSVIGTITPQSIIGYDYGEEVNVDNCDAAVSLGSNEITIRFELNEAGAGGAYQEDLHYFFTDGLGEVSFVSVNVNCLQG